MDFLHACKVYITYCRCVCLASPEGALNMAGKASNAMPTNSWASQPQAMGLLYVLQGSVTDSILSWDLIHLLTHTSSL